MARYLSGSVGYSLPIRDAHFCVVKLPLRTSRMDVIGDFYKKMSTEDKPAFLFSIRKYDPARKAFRLGHAVTSSLTTLGAVFGIGYENPSLYKIDILNMICVPVVLAVCVAAGGMRGARRDALPIDAQYAKADEEYVQWRMMRSDASKITVGQAFCAGVYNGFIHNAVSMTARGGILGLGAVFYVAKEVYQRHLLPKIKPHKAGSAVEAADKTLDDLWSFYCSVRGYTGSLTSRSVSEAHERLANQLACLERNRAQNKPASKMQPA